jgi:hypothetical protein
VRPYLAPLTRSIAAPAGRLVPAQGHSQAGPELYADNEGMNDRGNPYSFGSLLRAIMGPGYNPTSGSRYSAPAAVHNADVTHSPIQPRMAMSPGAFVTPAHLWNLSGIASGWSRPFAPNQGQNPRQPTAKLAFGRLGLTGAPLGGAGVRPPLPTLPEAQRMVQPQL